MDLLYLFGSQLPVRPEGTTPDLKLLTTAHSQDRIDVVVEFFLFRGDVVGLSIATRYGVFKCYAPTRNLITIIEFSFVMALYRDYVFEQDFEPNCCFGGFILLLTLDEKRQLHLMKPHCWGRLPYHYIETLQVTLLFENLLSHHFERSLPRLLVDMARLYQP
jgi:hypothetical protein